MVRVPAASSAPATPWRCTYRMRSGHKIRYAEPPWMNVGQDSNPSSSSFNTTSVDREPEHLFRNMPIRILCLHGQGVNADIFRKQTGKQCIRVEVLPLHLPCN